MQEGGVVVLVVTICGERGDNEPARQRTDHPKQGHVQAREQLAGRGGRRPAREPVFRDRSAWAGLRNFGEGVAGERLVVQRLAESFGPEAIEVQVAVNAEKQPLGQLQRSWYDIFNLECGDGYTGVSHK